MRGVSFRHRSSKKFHSPKYKLQDFFSLHDLSLDIEKDTPPILSNQDVKRFLFDHGRNEINSQISRCIDFISKWSGILKVCERCFPNRSFLNAETILDLSEDPKNIWTLNNEVEIYLSIKKLIFHWKHNLQIIEMSSQAQYYLR